MTEGRELSWDKTTLKKKKKTRNKERSEQNNTYTLGGLFILFRALIRLFYNNPI